MTQQFVQPCSKDSDEEEEYDVGECTEVHDQNLDRGQPEKSKIKCGGEEVKA